MLFRDTFALQFLYLNPEIFSQSSSSQKLYSQTMRIENKRVKALDTLITLQKAAEDYETKLGIERAAQWTLQHPEWIRVARLMHLMDFQRVCDRLEGLVVARCFELAKVNQSGICKFNFTQMDKNNVY